ncbi:MAG TPA: hypothetical protein VGG16_12675 [Streptosporangiaceae bacterium]|jgi:hypothetical protein
MAAESEPDLADLFAPVNITDAVEGVLGEARAALGHLDDPVDAELWGSDVIGAMSSGGELEAMTAIAARLLPAAEREPSPAALAMLRVFAAIGSRDLRQAARAAAERIAAKDVPDAPWAKQIGSPRVRACWHYADVGGRQESLTLTFAYGEREHALCVLIDHGRGGKIKDVWVAKGDNLLQATELTAGTDPLVEFEILDAPEARKRLKQAMAAGECPEQPDQADDITAHRALLRARLEQLTPE